MVRGRVKASLEKAVLFANSLHFAGTEVGHWRTSPCSAGPYLLAGEVLPFSRKVLLFGGEGLPFNEEVRLSRREVLSFSACSKGVSSLFLWRNVMDSLRS
jgi:hypothetical protein